MSAKDKQLEQSPRRHVRWLYLVDEWPEGRGLDHTDAILQAPEEAVIAAIVRDRDRYAQVLNDERLARRKAEHDLDQLRQAIRLVLNPERRNLLQRALTQLDLFDDPDHDTGARTSRVVDVPTGGHL